ncbi:DUF1707 SHOCT-like domain-containing protein [Corynebacterium camporealensis]
MSETPKIRCSNADRNTTVDILTSALSAGQLDFQEFEDRSSAAYNAKTKGELAKLTADLDTSSTDRSSTETSPQRHSTQPPAKQRANSLALFGGSTVKNCVLAKKHLNLTAFGGSEIDLRNVELSAPVTEINVYALFGGTEIVVPDNVRVEIDGVGIFGGFGSSDEPKNFPPNAPTVQVTGLALFGGVNVKFVRD